MCQRRQSLMMQPRQLRVEFSFQPKKNSSSEPRPVLSPGLGTPASQCLTQLSPLLVPKIQVDLLGLNSPAEPRDVQGVCLFLPPKELLSTKSLWGCL